MRYGSPPKNLVWFRQTNWPEFKPTTRSEKIQEIEDIRDLLKAVGHATRDFARSHPGLYQTMMQFQLQPDDAESALVIQEFQQFFQLLLGSSKIEKTKLIDMMRTANAAIVGFITLERSGLLTLPRSTDESFEVMLDGLYVAIDYIRQSK